MAARRSRTLKTLDPAALQLGVLGALVVASFCVFAVDAIDAAAHNRVFIGAGGIWAYDQLQYLGWSTDAAHHVLIADVFAIRLGAHVFFDPLWLIIGVLHVWVGMSYSLLIALGQTVGLLALFLAFRAYARSLLSGSEWRVTVALLLGLFTLPASFLIADRLSFVGAKVVNFETLSVGWVSDDFQVALAVAAMIVFLTQVRTLLASPGERWTSRPAWIAAGAGVAAAWFHPWQGISLLFILVGLVVWERPSLQRHSPLLVPALLTALPVAYYALLPHIDPGWSQSSHHTAYSWTPYVPVLLLTLGPVVLMMAPGYAVRSEDPAVRMLKLWPIAAVLLCVVAPSDAMHAFEGFSVPAAVLTVRGWPWLRERLPARLTGWSGRLAAAAIVFTLVAAPISVVHHLTEYRAGDQSFAELDRHDAAALDWIASRPANQGVLTSAEDGAWAPAVTAHRAWLGHGVWTPSYGQRNREVTALFGGAMDGDPAAERAFVRSTDAKIVLEPCGSTAHLERALSVEGFTAKSFGCATVWAVRGR